MSGADWSAPARVFQHLLAEEDAIGLDPASLVAEARQAGADTILVMGGGFSAWYPSLLACQRVNPRMRGDILGEVTSAARAAGLRVIARLDFSKGRPEWLDPHPDWFVQGPDGAPELVWEMPQTCATGSYWENEVFAILDEMLGHAPIDGVFVNYFHVPRCHCARCGAIVRREIGIAVPPAGTMVAAYERWRGRRLLDFLRRMRRFVHDRRPGAVVIPYHHLREGWDIRGMAREADLLSAQISNPLVVNPIDPQPIWRHWAAEEALLAQALKPERPPILVQSASGFFASRRTALPPDRLVRNVIEAAAHGAGTAIAISGPLARQDDARHAPAIRELGRYLKANARLYAGLESIAKVAILRSRASIDFGPDAGRAAGRPERPGHGAELRGLFEALGSLRHPGAILPDQGLTAEALAPFSVVVLPAVSCLDEADARALDAFVMAGGTLVATADTGARDADGEPRAVPALECLPWLPGEPRSISGAYFVIGEKSLRTRLGVSRIGADGQMWAPPIEPGATTDLALLGPFANNAPEFVTLLGEAGPPGLIARAHGRGRAVWLPWRLGAAFHAHGAPEPAAVLGHVIEAAAGPPPIRSDAPQAVSFVLCRHPEGYLLHGLNDAVPVGKPLVASAPLAGFRVALRLAVTRAIRLDRPEAVDIRREGDEAILEIDRLETFAAFMLY